MFENISIANVVIHEVFKRGPNREIVDPIFGDQTIVLDAEAMTALRDRLLKPLGNRPAAWRWIYIRKGQAAG